MSGCDSTDKVKQLLRAMARAKIKEGHTDPDVILSHIHSAISDHTPLHRGEIADIISGHGGTKAAKTDLQSRVAAFYAELRDLRKAQAALGKTPPVPANRDPARAAAIEKQMTDLQRQIDYGADAEEGKPAKAESPQISALKAQRDDLKRQLENLKPAPPATRPLDPNEVRNKALRTSLQNRIADLERKIAAGDTTDQGQFRMKRDDHNKELQAQHDALKAEWNALRDPGEEAKTRTRLQADIDRIDAKIAAGDKGRQRVQGADSAEVAALKSERAAKNSLLNSMKDRPVNTASPNILKNKARQKVIEKEIARLQARIAANDYSKPAPRKSPLYTDETQKLQARLNDVRAQYERNAMTAERANRSTAAKVGDMLVELHRAAVLTSPNVLLKLPATAVSNIAIRPGLLEPVGQALRRIPGLKDVAARAPAEGGAGGYFGTEGAALKRTFSKDTAKAVADYATTGTHELQSLYGKRDVDFQSDFKLAQYIGNIHGALKVPAAINQWSRAVMHRSASEAQAARARGMSDEAVAAHMADATTKAKIAAEAWTDAEREIFQNPNMLSDAYSALLGRLEAASKNGSASAAIASKTLKFFLPITKVPTNIAIAGSSYAAGAVGAITHLAAAARKGGDKGIWQNAVANLTPEQADSVMRNLKRQTVGIAALTIGAYLYKNFGGMYQQGDSKNKAKPDSETIKIGGYRISKQVLEHPLLTAMQLGATAAWVAHKPKGDKAAGALAAAKGLAEKVPFVREAGDVGTAFESTKQMGKFAGSTVGSMNPQAIQWLARVMDRDSTGKEIKRSPKNFTQEIEAGIPGVRKNVPRSPVQ